MTRDEWEGLCLLIEEWWPGEFGDVTAGAWFDALSGFDRDAVLAALRACLARGSRWRPSVPEIVAEIRCDPGRPTFAEALQLIYGPGGVLRARTHISKGRWELGERERLDDEAALERAAELHRLIGEFVQRQGLRRLRSLDCDDQEWGHANRKQLAHQWEEFVDVAETRDVATLVAGRRGELDRFDPLRSLGGIRQIEQEAS